MARESAFSTLVAARAIRRVTMALFGGELSVRDSRPRAILHCSLTCGNYDGNEHQEVPPHGHFQIAHAGIAQDKEDSHRHAERERARLRWCTVGQQQRVGCC